MNKTTLVLGASLKPERYSNIAINRLRDKDYEVKAFGLKPGEVNNVPIDTELISYNDIDTITLYLNPTRQKFYYDYIISLSPKRVIFNPGTENPELYKLLEENNIEVEVACTLVLLATNQY
ncbi:CoA-binding protein [Winogradskyella vincentii]|uniref:CoA-binding protein n=1 Tax=Winogradskyella vincentii TaxID=2877122 RepID=A0ABS7Y1K4_9FLAO|nr:CoA-binding protein [Winogradskyella vincentii]MCA0153806.1 CoA-binding protein [Winogradskyella vincentii]